MTPLRVAVLGASGRMGRALLRLIAQDARWTLAAAVTAPGDPLIGTPVSALVGGGGAGPFELRADIEAACDVAIDFTSPEACVEWAARCAARGVALVSGSTGLSADQHARLAELAKDVPVLWSANMSLGVNLLLRLVEQAASRLGPSWDCEIVETHHRQKADAPSGTAMALLEAVKRGRATGGAPTGQPGAGRDNSDCSGSDGGAVGVSSTGMGGEIAPAIYGRSGRPGPRPQGEIALHALRMGGVVGDHDLHFATEGEILTLRHHAESRDIFARGALEAAAWLHGKRAGLYAIRDMLD